MALSQTDFHDLCFVNLVDFDTLWGHRRDPVAYAEGLSRFDAWLPALLAHLTDEDVLMITADHGCDPSFTKTTDHTREYVPLLIYGGGLLPEALGTRNTFSDVAATVAALLGVSFPCDGTAIPLRRRPQSPD